MTDASSFAPTIKSGSKSSLSRSLICTAGRRILATPSTNQGGLGRAICDHLEGWCSHSEGWWSGGGCMIYSRSSNERSSGIWGWVETTWRGVNFFCQSCSLPLSPAVPGRSSGEGAPCLEPLKQVLGPSRRDGLVRGVIVRRHRAPRPPTVLRTKAQAHPQGLKPAGR